ncbi:MAG: hypothetical protein KAY15_02065 [Polaromonas sp.]|jgi:hypothetical protein|uniref:Uncharacterized protein n=1 Tax=Limnohabitans parvus II-B4 TaxID=1293052 RepID=A0A315EIK4_9BURK|nr:hypothetical protein [Limnohabitans parvus]MBP8087537.1 hypothetical protein [Polaromonas sp.]PUE55882.1 hypothetical protein B9Z37_02530 [Limnohabitans parvus II-B4]
MSTDLDTLSRMTAALDACTRGELRQNDMIQLWRHGAATLPLPEKFGVVLADLLDRIEASALFSGESCSFSQQGLFDNLQLWAGKARDKLTTP